MEIDKNITILTLSKYRKNKSQKVKK